MTKYRIIVERYVGNKIITVQRQRRFIWKYWSTETNDEFWGQECTSTPKKFNSVGEAKVYIDNELFAEQQKTWLTTSIIPYP